MTTTAHGLALFLEALLANRILSAATRTQMLTPQIAIHSAHQFPTFDPATGNDGEQFGLAYGLGWGLLPRMPTVPPPSKRATVTPPRTMSSASNAAAPA